MLRRVDEEETQSAAADERGDVGYAVELLDVIAEVFGKSLGRADVGAGREVDIDHELRACGRREETLVDMAEAVESGGKTGNGESHDQPAVTQCGGEQLAVDAERQGVVGIAGGLRAAGGERTEENVAEQGRGGDRGNPTEA